MITSETRRRICELFPKQTEKGCAANEVYLDKNLLSNGRQKPMLCGLSIKEAMAGMIIDPQRNNQNREKCQLVHNCKRKRGHNLQPKSLQSITVVLNWWAMTPHKVAYQISCISNFYIMIYNSNKITVMKWHQSNLWLVSLQREELY